MSMQWIGPEMFGTLEDAAARTPRRRMNRNFHSSADDPLQRMLNVVLADSYVPPHRHAGKAETLLVLDGEAGAFLFDDAGRVVASRRLGGAGEACGIDIPPGLWHTVAALSSRLVLFEAKPGPFDPAAPRSLAPWAPAEGDPDAPGYLQRLISGLG